MRSDRAEAIARFLAGAGWGEARRTPIAGDASSRRYERLQNRGQTAILMDAPDAGSSTRRFIAVAEHLRACGLSAPRILAHDLSRGLMLLEDFGDTRFPEVLTADPTRETEVFLAATDTLIALHRQPPPQAPDLGPAVLVAQSALAYDSYLPALTGKTAPDQCADMQARLVEAFAALPPWTPVLALRDFHAGNLFWLPARKGPARIGLIDFQDAGLTHPLYDLVSLARDARRTVAPETTAAMQTRYRAATGIEPESAWALLAVQRNLRILGVFARLALDHGKPGYLDHLPHTWALMVQDLQHPSLTRLKTRLLADLPPPTPDAIARLRHACPPKP
ncbi:MAG: aminoglycoside phosphotransferase [Rhodobacterales bacterium]|nr:MAG: aminoglycoside phosphotransferase [Rhodobacterales bacterium]